MRLFIGIVEADGLAPDVKRRYCRLAHVRPYIFGHFECDSAGSVVLESHVSYTANHRQQI